MRGSSSRSFSYGHMDTQLLAGQAQSGLNCHLRIETIWPIISHLVNGVCTTFKCLGLLAWVSFSHQNSLCALLNCCPKSQNASSHSSHSYIAPTRTRLQKPRRVARFQNYKMLIFFLKLSLHKESAIIATDVRPEDWQAKVNKVKVLLAPVAYCTSENSFVRTYSFSNF